MPKKSEFEKVIDRLEQDLEAYKQKVVWTEEFIAELKNQRIKKKDTQPEKLNEKV